MNNSVQLRFSWRGTCLMGALLPSENQTGLGDRTSRERRWKGGSLVATDANAGGEGAMWGPESVTICRRALLTPPQALPPRMLPKPGHSRQLQLIHTWRLLVLTYVCNHYHPHNQDRNSLFTATTPLCYPSVVTPFPTPNPGHHVRVLRHNRFAFLRLLYQWSHTPCRL